MSNFQHDLHTARSLGFPCAKLELLFPLLKVLAFLLIRCSANTVEGYRRHGATAPTNSLTRLREGGGTGLTLPRMPAPSPAPSPHEAGLKDVNGTLDPSQVQALLSLGLVTGPDPCNTESHRTLICDGGAPYKHLLSLHLEYCTEGAILPSSAWHQLASLKALDFEECPAKPFHVPLALAGSLESLAVVASFGRSVSNVMAPPLPGTWIGSFYNLVELSVADVEVNATSLHAMVMNMKKLQSISIAGATLRGSLPLKWPSPRVTMLHLPHNELSGHIPHTLANLEQLESLDLSFNNLQGGVPEELGSLQNLQYLSLASNQLNGGIPNFIQNLKSLVYLDLSHNQFAGSIPGFFTNMANLRYIDMRGNNLEGVVPFPESFLQGLNSCKLGGNPGLCYNKSVIEMSVGFVQGVMPCEREWGEAPSPSPEAENDDDDDAFKGMQLSERGPNMLVILIALALACTVGAILTATLLTRHCHSKA